MTEKHNFLTVITIDKKSEAHHDGTNDLGIRLKFVGPIAKDMPLAEEMLRHLLPYSTEKNYSVWTCTLAQFLASLNAPSIVGMGGNTLDAYGSLLRYENLYGDLDRALYFEAYDYKYCPHCLFETEHSGSDVNEREETYQCWECKKIISTY